MKLTSFKHALPRWGMPLVCLVALLVAAGVWFETGIQPAGGSAQVFEVKAGETKEAIAKRLQDAHVIKSWRHFILLSYLTHRTILAGTFSLDPTHSLVKIVNDLSSSRSMEQVITIPEGWRREQIADYLITKNINKEEFLQATQDKEGQLFPDTYYLPLHPAAAEIAERMMATFHRKTDDLHVTPEQLIIASIVEREAKADSDRSLIAGIYFNRLKHSMSLEADPTVQYARDSILLSQGTLTTYWKPITVSQYQSVQSRYNTYLINGLPPAPICNPGLKSIEAAQSPAVTDALYFFHTSDGQTITSRNLDEHNRNKKKYL